MILLGRGAQVDSLVHTGASALHLACQEGHVTVALSLLQAGASLTLADRQGARPIHLAAQFNRTAVVRLLLEHGAEPDQVCTDHYYWQGQNGHMETGINIYIESFITRCILCFIKHL